METTITGNSNHSFDVKKKFGKKKKFIKEKKRRMEALFGNSLWSRELFSWGTFFMALYRSETIICFDKGVELIIIVLVLLAIWFCFFWFYYLSKSC